jgi:hypothetical protein
MLVSNNRTACSKKNMDWATLWLHARLPQAVGQFGANLVGTYIEVTEKHLKIGCK